MNTELETMIMDIIVGSGSCKSCAIEAISFAKEKDFENAEKSLAAAEEEIIKAHHSQTQLIQKEAGGEKTELSLLLIHSQDHLMTSLLCKDMAKEFVDLYKKL